MDLAWLCGRDVPEEVLLGYNSEKDCALWELDHLGKTFGDWYTSLLLIRRQTSEEEAEWMDYYERGCVLDRALEMGTITPREWYRGILFEFVLDRVWAIRSGFVTNVLSAT